MNVQSAVLAQLKDVVRARHAAPEIARDVPAAEEFPGVDSVLSAALLVTSAFRMRDEAALISTLRLLTDAVTGWEAAQAEACMDD